MAMAAEFPDVFKLFESPKPKTGKTSGMDLQLFRAGQLGTNGGSDEARNVKRRRGTDPGPTGRRESVTRQDESRRDSEAGTERRDSRNEDEPSVNIHDDHSYSSDQVVDNKSSQPSPIPQPTPSPIPPLPEVSSPYYPSLADIDDIFSSLDATEDASFYLTKAAYVCTWGGPGPACNHAEQCPFVRQYLGLSDLSENQLHAPKVKENAENEESTGRIVVMQQTSSGLVKVNEVLHRLGSGGSGQAQQLRPAAVQLRPESTQQGLDSMGMRSYSVQLRPDQIELLQNRNTQTKKIVRLPLQKEQIGNPNQTGQQLQHSNQIDHSNQMRPQLQLPAQRRQQLQQQNQISMEQLFQYSNGPNQQSTMRAVNASNSNVTVKCPTPSPTFIPSSTPSPIQNFHIPTPSPSPPTAVDQMTSNMMFPCAECPMDFYDNKGLTKHTRNHHQPYTCSTPGCSTQTVGYYRMAVHKKSAHRQTPLFSCECGRNFAEKKGITKHQNNCKLYKRTAEF